MGEREDNYVFLLWHSRPIDDHPTSPDTDDKLIGVFSSETAAEAARKTVIDQPGFRDWPEAFEISRNKVDRINWTEGFTSWDEASQDL